MINLGDSFMADKNQESIRNALLPIVGKKCALFNLPYHDNIGDVLIWEGVESFFHDNGIECVGRFSIYTFDHFKLDSDVSICINGGGSLGDTWRGFQEEMNRIIEAYPNNRIVILPQSVFYNDKSLAHLDSQIFGSHKDLIICARDKVSYEFLCGHFSNKILLVPDMALYLHFGIERKKQPEKKLFLRRTDKEAIDYSRYDLNGLEIHDWPTIEYVYFQAKKVSNKDRIRRKFLRLGLKVLPHIFAFKLFEIGLVKSLNSDKVGIGKRWRNCYDELRYLIYLNEYKLKGELNRLIDWYANKYYRPITVSYGIDFIKQYDVVYSTRLHGGLLSVILGKKCYLIDNSNHKISAFYDTWRDLLGERVFLIK